jgi:hypothetical protein
MAKKIRQIYEGLPNDLMNFPHNPLACAVRSGSAKAPRFQTFH